MKQLWPKLRPYLTHPFAFIALGLLISLGPLMSYYLSSNKLTQLEEIAINLQTRKKWSEWRAKEEGKLISLLKSADRDYIEKALENMQFLQPEVKKLQALLYSDPSNEKCRRRLDALQNGQNELKFREQNFQRIGNLQEVDVIQHHPIEMNSSDLKKTLARIENVPIGAHTPGKRPPHFMIKNFELTKKPWKANEELFIVNMDLIKQEMN